MNISRLLIGSISSTIGIALLVFSFATGSFIITGIYGLIFLAFGIFIFFNVNEDKIEKIRKRR